MNNYKKGKFYSYTCKVQCIYCALIYPQNEGNATETGSKCFPCLVSVSFAKLKSITFERIVMNNYKKGKFYSYTCKVQCIYCALIYPQNEDRNVFHA